MCNQLCSQLFEPARAQMSEKKKKREDQCKNHKLLSSLETKLQFSPQNYLKASF